MLKLRPYQEVAVEKAIEYFKEDSDEPSLIVLPTAWGKSILTAFVAANIPQYERLLVVQPTKELLEQNYNKFIALCGEDSKAGIYSASFGKKQIERITYATIGSIKNNGKEFKEKGFTKMLIDEAHLYPRKEESMLGHFLKESGIRQVLGVTATPLKMEQFGEKHGDHFDKWSQLIMLTNPSPSGSFFKKIIHCGQIQEMTQLGFWSPLRYERIPFDPKELKLNTTGSDYSESSLEESYILNNIRQNIYAALDYHSERKHCLVFVPSVEEAAILAEDYKDAAYVSGDMAKTERNRIINEFKAGNIRIIFNCAVLSCGFDYTKIDMIIFGTSMMSVARYYQMVGRGVRIDEEKKDCLIVDMGGNVDRFGKVEDMYFKFGQRWRMYGSNNTLLSGIPIQCLGKITRTDINRIYTYRSFADKWKFGKYKDLPIKNSPMNYLTWNLICNKALRGDVRDGIIHTMENKVRDTRNEPPETTMPDGQYAGKQMSFVSRGYLAYYYHSKEWNECNDNVRRGLELVYGGIPPHLTKYKSSQIKTSKTRENKKSNQDT